MSKLQLQDQPLLLRVATLVACGMVSASIGYLVLVKTMDFTNTATDFTFLVGIICGLLALVGSSTVQAFFAGHRVAAEVLDNTLRLDPQTGLLSRNGFSDALNEFMKEQKNDNAMSGAFLIAFEFDSIKDINEIYGHEIGDTIIRILADRLRRIVGELGPIGRISGSEYVLAIKAASNDRELKAAVDALIDAMSQPIKIAGISMAVFGNAGVVKLSQRNTKLETALRCATLARASARDAGRGTWAIYHPEMSQLASYRKWLESELATALQRNELSLHYQPQVEYSTGRIVGHEALLRWTHHEKGSIAPSEFISIAEHCGLIRPIGIWILRKACMDAMRMDPSIIVSVNVSSAQIMDADFTTTLRRILSDTGLPPERLELEVTESVVISDYALVRKRFAEIHEIGCPIAIDDFGTGYSNLTNLAELSFNKLKIDKSFVDRMLHQRNIGSIVNTIVNLAHSLNATVIAEGVESRDQAVVLNNAGCPLFQGYLYSKPLQLAEVMNLGTHIHIEPDEAVIKKIETAQPCKAEEPEIPALPAPATAYQDRLRRVIAM